MPINESVNFPNGPDTFPVLTNYSQESGTDRFILDASHHNKIRSFIAAVEPRLGGTSATSDGTLSMIGYSYTFSVSFRNLFVSCAYNAQLVGKMPRTNVLPYQFVLTESLDSYPTPVSNSLVGIIKASSGQLNQIIGTQNNYLNYPLVTCVVRKSGALSSQNFNLSKYFISSNVILGTDTMLIQGLILDTTTPAVSISASGLSNMPSIWSNIDDLEILCSITGVN
jgi:hypothetical protein